MAPRTDTTDYILASEEEVSRLSNQHKVVIDAMGGFFFAPIDLSAKSLQILDSATADGMFPKIPNLSHHHLQIEHESHVF